MTSLFAKTKAERQFIRVEISDKMRKSMAITNKGVEIDRFAQYVQTDLMQKIWNLCVKLSKLKNDDDFPAVTDKSSDEKNYPMIKFEELIKTEYAISQNNDPDSLD